MITLLIILAFVAVCFIYLLQFKTIRDYQPDEKGYYYEVITDTGSAYYPVEGVYYDCKLVRYSIF